MAPFDPFLLPDYAHGYVNTPDGNHVWVYNTGEEALAQNIVNSLTSEPSTFPDGQQRPLTREEILFLKYLGRTLIVAISRITGLPLTVLL